MENKFTGKINNASYGVMCTMLSLFKKDMTMPELIQSLKDLFPGVEFNNFVASKYINTCKSCGIDIQKINGKYCFINFPVGEKFTDTEASLAYELAEFSEDLKPTQLNADVNSFIEKLHLVGYKASNGIRSSKNRRVLKLYEKARDAKCNIRIIYADGKEEECFPKEVFVSANGKILLRTTSETGLHEIDPDNIINIKITEQTDCQTTPYEETIFELRGKLAKRYQLRENEQIVKIKKNGNLVIANKYETKDKLFRRLMRYDSSCKLLKPKAYVDEFKDMLTKSIENYN